MNNTNTTSSLLYPANIQEILEEFNDLFQVYDKLVDRDSIYASFRADTKRLEVLFPLREHPIHGITGLRACEKYNDNGYVQRYEYQWKRIIPKSGIQTSHIASWGNDPHDANWTPGMYRVHSEPHHHHYDPMDRKKRRSNWEVRTLRNALLFVKHYIDSGEEYKG